MDPDGYSILFIILIAVLMLLGALLTAGMTALTVMGDSSVKKMTSSSNQKARFIAVLLEKRSSFQQGIRLAGLACTVLAAMLTFHLIDGIVFVRYAHSLSAPWAPFAISALVCSVLVLLLDVFCLLLPSRIACRHPQTAALALAKLCWFVWIVLRPFVMLNGAIAELLAHALGVRTEDEPEQVTEEEIRLLVDVGNEKGAIEQSEKDMINNIFEFDDRYVSEVMTHRTDMTAVSQTAGLEEITALAIETGYSRIPVYKDDIDDIMGIIYVKDLLCLIGRNEADFKAQAYMRSALFVPENMSCIDLFAQFKLQKVQIAIVVDEYGGTAGIVSMEDLLESIVGNMQDEYDNEEEEISKLSKDCYSLDGSVSISEVERLFGVRLDEDSDYDTLGGLLTEVLERIPSPDEHPAVELSGIRFTITLVKDRRIARVRAERLPSGSIESQSV
ncbi:hemolysin family protein [Oscillospiraceae bacterium PP1C4]